MAEARMKLARKMAKEALTSTRNLSMELRDREVRWSLKAALENLLHEAIPPGICSELVIEGDESLIPSHTRNHLFLLLREAVRNAVAHSGCDRVTVELDITPQRAAGAVEDDGRGFMIEEVRSGGGFRSMEERASLVGGTFGISSEPNGGTKVKVSVPLESA
jgi:signal transduction histidine kinase